MSPIPPPRPPERFIAFLYCAAVTACLAAVIGGILFGGVSR